MIYFILTLSILKLNLLAMNLSLTNLKSGVDVRLLNLTSTITIAYNFTVDWLGYKYVKSLCFCVYQGEFVDKKPAIKRKFNEDRRNNSGPKR